MFTSVLSRVSLFLSLCTVLMLSDTGVCQAQNLPDLTVVALDNNGCDGPSPVIVVVVENRGAVAASAYVDVFVGLPAPPPIGSWGEYYQQVTLAPGQSQSLYFSLDPMYHGTSQWIDVLIDTDQWIAESDETNNHFAAQLNLDICP